ncbi:MAG TPA: YHYH protein [Fimbriimonadaceae bacterium]
MITALVLCMLMRSGSNLVSNADFTMADVSGAAPANYELTGAAKWTSAGYADEIAGKGISLDSTQSAGSVGQLVQLNRNQGKWVTFRIRGKAEDGFAVNDGKLFLQIDFYDGHGGKYEDRIRRLIYRQVLQDRKDFAVNGDDHKNGAAVWRSYDLEELLPFAETDAVKVSVGFENGVGKPNFSRFVVTNFEVRLNPTSSDGRVDPADRVAKPASSATSTEGMIRLGGRWYYKPAAGENLTLSQPLTITEANSSQLFYKDDRLSNPFEGNMTAWLRKGFYDEGGNLVTQDRFIPNNVTLTFDGSAYFTIHARNIPNHPTAKFPDTYGTQGYNGNHIQEHNYTYKLPLVPTLATNPRAVDQQNIGMALPMGAIGLAVNGVVFYNPFDAGMQDATGIMDRCCGHPSPDNRYHYHKYPICVNTPFIDRGETHSPLIGFAFDGLPIYGPYESKGVMAKDLTENKLNAFNAHYDPERGWHYHVTPGQFPYIIGGFFGNAVTNDRPMMGPSDGGR